MDAASTWDLIPTSIGELLWIYDEDAVESHEIQQGRAFEGDGRPLLHTLPKPPSNSRYYFKKLQKRSSVSNTYGVVASTCFNLIQQCIRNNDYLLALYGITENEQHAALNSDGIIYTLRTLDALRQGKVRSVNMILVTAMAVYWGEPLNRFMTQDYPTKKLKPYRPEPPKRIAHLFSTRPNELRRTYGLSETPIK